MGHPEHEHYTAHSTYFPQSFSSYNLQDARISREIVTRDIFKVMEMIKAFILTFSGGVAIMYYLVTLNSAVNPFIYIAFNRELRRPLLRLFPFLTRYIIVVGYD